MLQYAKASVAHFGPSFVLVCVSVRASCLFVFCRCGMAQREASQVSLGLLDDEAVLRGGHLIAPVVLQNLQVVDGKQFVRLSQTDKALCQFLSGQCKQSRPLSTCAVFKKMVALRQAFVHQFLLPCPPFAAEDDHAAALGLDAEDALGKPKRLRAKRIKSVKKQLPEWFSATLPTPGRPDWHVTVLVESGNFAPCIEVTQLNFDALLAIVEVERGEASGESPKKLASRRSPRGERGSREYWIESKRRWVTVQYDAGVGDASHKKKRTLLRKSSDTAAVLPLGDIQQMMPLLPLAAPALPAATSGFAPEVEEALRQGVNDHGSSSNHSTGDREASDQVPKGDGGGDPCEDLFE